MNHTLTTLRHVLLCAAVALSACLPSVVRAGPVTYEPTLDGTGITVYTANTGTPATGGSGAWTGTLVDSPFPVPALPLSLLTQVNFSFDAINNLLTGDFEFTSDTDFNSTITGLLSGTFLTGDFETGGQLSLDYDIRGGTGGFISASGFLISLLDVLPTGGGFGTYREVATGVFTVPEPSALALAGLALLAALMVSGQRRGATRPFPHAV